MKIILLSIFFLNTNLLIASETDLRFEEKAQHYIDKHCNLSKNDFNKYRKKYPKKDDISFIFISACIADESGKSIDFVIDYSNKFKDGAVLLLTSLAISKCSGRDLDEILKEVNGSVEGVEKILKNLNLKQELINDRMDELRAKLDLEPAIKK